MELRWQQFSGIPLLWCVGSWGDFGGAKAGNNELLELLAPAELEYYLGLRYRKRRRDWLLGRLVAKGALGGLIYSHTHIQCSPRELAVLNAPTGRPQVRLSPRRWRFLPSDPAWRAFFISAAGEEGEEVVIQDVRITGADVPGDWVLNPDCDVDHGDPRGATLTVGAASASSSSRRMNSRSSARSTRSHPTCAQASRSGSGA